MKSAYIIPVLALVLLVALLAPAPPAGGAESASRSYRYREYEASSGYYEEYEVRPGLGRGLLKEPSARTGMLAYGPGPSSVRLRSRLSDAHWNLAGYARKNCADCHASNAKDNIHVVRNGLQCRQCHGGEPIAAVAHYYSPLNRIRRHAYVCAKCHQGAGVSFASYLVHEPDPSAPSTRESFPVLFYAFWTMAVLAAGTFLVLLPHTALWGLRELFRKGRGKGGGP